MADSGSQRRLATQLLFRDLIADLAQPRSCSVAGAVFLGLRTERLMVLAAEGFGSSRSLCDFMEQFVTYTVGAQRVD